MKTVMQRIEDAEDRLSKVEEKVRRIMLGLEPDVERVPLPPKPHAILSILQNTPKARARPHNKVH